MLIFEGTIDGHYWAQTRPLRDLYFTYQPGSEWRAEPSINLATSPDARHWKPCLRPGIRPHAATAATARMGGGTPAILTERGWLTLWHGVEPEEIVGVYRTYWSILGANDTSRMIATDHAPLLEATPELTRDLKDQMYVRDVVFTTGIANGGDHYVVVSGEGGRTLRAGSRIFRRRGSHRKRTTAPPTSSPRTCSDVHRSAHTAPPCSRNHRPRSQSGHLLKSRCLTSYRTLAKAGSRTRTVTVAIGRTAVRLPRSAFFPIMVYPPAIPLFIKIPG
jgi:hypothetical protein